MTTKVVLNTENTINFAFSEKTAEEAILKVLKEQNLSGEFEVDLKIVDKNEIQVLNKKYRHKDAPTDALSFPIHDKIDFQSSAPILLGDIILCPAMAEESLEKLIEHSVLHLVGIHHPGD